jgi:hypothetical protein
MPEWKIVGKYINAALLLGSFVGLIMATESHYAKAEELNQLKVETKRYGQRLEQKIQQDRYNSNQDRIWKIEDRYLGMRNAPPIVVDQYRNLQRENQQLDHSIKQIQREIK